MRITLGTYGGLGFPVWLHYTWIGMAKPVPKSKSALDALIGSVSRVRSEARGRMSEDDFRRAEKKFDEVVNKVRASRGRKRETA